MLLLELIIGNLTNPTDLKEVPKNSKDLLTNFFFPYSQDSNLKNDNSSIYTNNYIYLISLSNMSHFFFLALICV